MTINIQRPIHFAYSCECIVDEEMLKSAMLWYACGKPMRASKLIFMQGKYPAITIGANKIHIHRILVMFNEKRRIKSSEIVKKGRGHIQKAVGLGKDVYLVYFRDEIECGGGTRGYFEIWNRNNGRIKKINVDRDLWSLGIISLGNGNFLKCPGSLQGEYSFLGVQNH
mgnify:CR=1 FL=1